MRNPLIFNGAAYTLSIFLGGFQSLIFPPGSMSIGRVMPISGWPIAGAVVGMVGLL